MSQSTTLLAVLLAAGALTAPAAQAQLRLGVKAGVTNSRLAGHFYESYKAKFGFHAGVLANYDVTGDGFFSVQPELLYSQKGYAVDKEQTFTIRDSGITQEVTYKDKGPVNYSYLDLPVLLRINARGLIFEAGPQLSYLLSLRNKVESSANGRKTNSEYWSGKLADARRWQWGYAAGLGYQFANGSTVGLRYHGNFTELSRATNTDFAGARNVAYQLYVGYLLGGK